MRKLNKVKLNDKAVKLMGLSPDQLVDTMINSDKGTLDVNQFDFFWDGIQGKRSKGTSVVVPRLLDYMAAVVNKQFKLAFPPQRILNTLQFFSLWFNIDNTPGLSQKLDKSKKAEDKIIKNDGIVGSRRVFKLLRARLNDSADVLSLLACWVSELPPFSPELNTLDGLYIPDGVSSSIYTYLKLICKDANNLERLLLLLLNEVKTVRRDPTHEEFMTNKLFAILHIFRFFFSYWRINNLDLMSNAMETFQNFYLWPFPVSRFVRSVLLRIKNEILAPSNCMLERFAAESRIPTLLNFEFDGESQIQRSRPIFYVIDGTCMRSASLFLQLNLRDCCKYFADVKEPEEVLEGALSVELQGLLLLSIIHETQQVQRKQAKILKFLTSEDVTSLFERAVSVLQECLKMKQEDAVNHRNEVFTEIRDDVVEIAKQNDEQKIESDLVFPESLPKVFIPSLGPLAHLAIIEHVYDTLEMPSRDEIRQLGFTPFIKGPIFQQLYSVLTVHKSIVEEGDAIEVRICLTGDDGLISRFLSAYMAIATEHSRLLDDITLRVFIVPFRRSKLAAFLARNDAWYNRHVYIPFSEENELLPSISINSDAEAFVENERPHETWNRQAPVLFLRDCVENYIREAVHQYPLRLYKVELWFQDRSTSRVTVGNKTVLMPEVVVPLVHEIEIGALAEGVESSDDWRATMRSRDYKPVDLKIRFSKIDLAGNVIEMDRNLSHLPPVTFQRICISNYPSRTSLGFPANPLEPALEMTVQALDQKKQRARTWCQMDPNQHVTTVDIVVGSAVDRFNAIIDSVRYRGIHAMSISPMEVEGKQLTLPVGMFFPYK